MNDFAVIVEKAFDRNGQHYEPGQEININGSMDGILLVQGFVRLTTSPAAAVPPKKRGRGRPKKSDTSAPNYQRRDITAEE